VKRLEEPLCCFAHLRRPQSQPRAARRPKPSRSRSCGPTWQVPLKADIAKVVESSPKKEGLCTEKMQQVVIRKARALLNKISMENESVIVAQLADLSYASSEASRTVAILLVDMAIRNPFQSEVYVDTICQLMCNSCVAFKDGVREEIERLYKSFFEVQLWDEELRNRAQALLRLLGNLFLADRISVDVLWQCIARLLRIEDALTGSCPPEAWIECCLELLDTVGQALARSSQGSSLQRAAHRQLRAWKDFTTPTGDPALSSRLRFLILNTLEGRAKQSVAFSITDV